MTFRTPTNEQVLADIRRRLDQGYTRATAERIKRLAARSSDVEFLRGMADALADAFINPKPRKQGRPRKNLQLPRTRNGAIDLDAIPAMTQAERLEWVRDFSAQVAACDRVHEAHTRRGTPIKTACELEGIGADTYYKWYPANS